MKNGYLAIHVGRGHHLAMANNYAYEHRLVAEEKIGRRLRKGEHVHHINGDKTDNRSENLEVCPTSHHHHRKHAADPSKRRPPGAENPLVPCGCGCGALILQYDKGGATRWFAVGHARRKPNELIKCACGCGGELLRWYVHKCPSATTRRERRFIHGHNLRVNQ